MSNPFYASIDQMGFPVTLERKPERIISLVPSQTEFLYDLGLEEEIVGLTKFCVHPQNLKKTKQIIGGTKSFHFEIINQLNPDLIIGNKEENYKEGIAKLREKYNVWMSDISTLEQASMMMKEVGVLVDKKSKSEEIIHLIENSFNQFHLPVDQKVLYLIWQNPLMSVGKDTFINEMLNRCGFENVIKGQERYPVITEGEIRNLKPDIILLSSEPFPFKERNLKEFQLKFPETAVKLVDGELFSWYGSRLLYSAAYFQEIYHQYRPTS